MELHSILDSIYILLSFFGTHQPFSLIRLSTVQISRTFLYTAALAPLRSVYYSLVEDYVTLLDIRIIDFLF